MKFGVIGNGSISIDYNWKGEIDIFHGICLAYDSRKTELLLICDALSAIQVCKIRGNVENL